MPSTHEFFTRQHEQLTRLETSIVQTQQEMEAARTTAQANLKESRDEAIAMREAFQQKMTAAVGQMQAGLAARKQATDAKVAEWKQKRQIERLEARAEAAEEYAEAAMAVLDLAQQEASAASIEAVAARREATEAKLAVGAAS